MFISQVDDELDGSLLGACFDDSSSTAGFNEDSFLHEEGTMAQIDTHNKVQKVNDEQLESEQDSTIAKMRKVGANAGATVEAESNCSGKQGADGMMEMGGGEKVSHSIVCKCIQDPITLKH